MLHRLWQDDGAAVISPELAVVTALLVVGLIVGLSALSTGLQTEIVDVGAAVEAFDFTPTLVPGDTPPPPRIIEQNPGSPQDGKPLTGSTRSEGGTGIVTIAEKFGGR